MPPMSFVKSGFATFIMLLLLVTAGPLRLCAEEPAEAPRETPTATPHEAEPSQAGPSEDQAPPVQPVPASLAVIPGQAVLVTLNGDWSALRQSLKSMNYEELQTGLKALEGRCMDLGVSSFEELSASMIKEGRRLQDEGNLAYATALYDSARRVSPNYPASYFASGWAILAQNKLKALSAVDMFIEGYRSFWNDFRWSYYYAGNKSMSLLFTLALLYSLFGFFAAVRYIQLLAHDISETVRRPDMEDKLKYLILPAAYVLVLLVLGFWWAVALTVLTLWVYFNKKEKALALLFFVLLVLMPDIMTGMSGFVQAGGNRLLWEMDEVNKGHIQDGAREFLQSELDKDPDNKWIIMSLAQVAKKQGRYAEAESLYLRLAAIDPESAIIRNNLANVYFIQGKNDLAIKEYKAAAEYQPDRPLVFFNMSQVYSESFIFTERDNADRTASQLDLEEAAFLREKAGDTPVRMVFDEQVPVEAFWKIAMHGMPGAKALAGSLWSTTVRVLPLQGSRIAGIAFIVLALTIGFLRKKKVFSHYCIKCGKVSCKVCQKPTYSKDLCPQCNQIFVKLDGVEARDRVRKMLEVREIHSKEGLRNRIASLLLPGSGHFLMGNPIGGFLFSGVFIFIVKDLFFGEFFEVPYIFSMPYISPTTILMVLVLVIFYVAAQLDSNRITKKRDILWH